jgi:hypothetical protein
MGLRRPVSEEAAFPKPGNRWWASLNAASTRVWRCSVIKTCVSTRPGYRRRCEFLMSVRIRSHISRPRFLPPTITNVRRAHWRCWRPLQDLVLILFVMEAFCCWNAVFNWTRQLDAGRKKAGFLFVAEVWLLKSIHNDLLSLTSPQGVSCALLQWSH